MVRQVTSHRRGMIYTSLILLLLFTIWLLPSFITSELSYKVKSLSLTSKQQPQIITIKNFKFQSVYKTYDIYPYTGITRGDFDKWVLEQNDISFDGILKNIGDKNWSPHLLKKNVSLGAVIASPSIKNPNYFYQWIRDSAITVNSITHHLSDSNFQNQSLQITIENYLNNSFNLQRLDNPSGKFDEINLLSLGEPKFMVDGTPFFEPWGRPQNDGPALRIITIDNFLNHLIKFNKNLLQNDFNDIKDIYFKIIKLDLKYIIKYWKSNNFDLWEEINSQHFFTSLTQLKALQIGIKYSKIYDSTDFGFNSLLHEEYQNLLNFIYKESGFINYNLNHIVQTPSILGIRSGLDAAIIIASILTHDEDDFNSDFPFNVNDGLILNTLSEMVKSMKYIYPINHNRVNLNIGVALGRYPEDVYDGTGISEGNPWFLTTLYASELLYKLIHKLYADGNDLIIDESNQFFYFNHIIQINSVKNSAPGTQDIIRLPFNSHGFNQTLKNVFDYADSFLDVVREHVSNEGSMSEQFNKYTGYNQGAADLTWSYGSYYNSFRWRTKTIDVFGF